jgi:hypothetical protein
VWTLRHAQVVIGAGTENLMSYAQRGPDRRSRRDPYGFRWPLARPERETLRGDVRGWLRPQNPVRGALSQDSRSVVHASSWSALSLCSGAPEAVAPGLALGALRRQARSVAPIRPGFAPTRARPGFAPSRARPGFAPCAANLLPQRDCGVSNRRRHHSSLHHPLRRRLGQTRRDL